MNKISPNKNFRSNRFTLLALSWLNFMWSFSSLMVFSVLPVFLVEELKIGHSQIGFIEGLAYSSAFAAKFFSGFLSDVMHKRKPLILIGTIFSLVSKPFFALAAGAYSISITRLLDRLSKGIRSAPNDALTADLSKPEEYGKNFALRQTFCSMGAVVGSLITVIIMMYSNNNYRLVFWLAIIPAILAVLILFFFIKPNPLSHPRNSARFVKEKIKISDLTKFSFDFWWLMFGFFFLMMARFSEAFLILQAKHIGWSIALLPLLIIIMDLSHAAVAIPSGKIADRENRKKMLAKGMLFIVAAQWLIAYSSSVITFSVGIILVGLHMGITQGLLRALVAQSTPPELRGTAFSIFFLISGAALFLGNAIAGKLSELFGLKAAFYCGCMFSIISILILLISIVREESAYRLFYKEQKN